MPISLYEHCNCIATPKTKCGNAKSAIATLERMQKLAETEAYMLRAMPVLPILHDTLNYLQKPYIHGFRLSTLGMPTCFKYTWVDLQK